MTELIGIIPAGGRGNRLAPYPSPKELFPMGWQPYVGNGEVHRRPKVVSQYVVEGMVQAGVRYLIMIVGPNKYDLLRYYGNGDRFGAHLSYLYQEDPLGMVHAIDLAYPWIKHARIALGMPDTIIYPNDAFAQVLTHHEERRADVTLALFTTSRPEKFGMVAVDAHGWITEHVDKPQESALTLMWGCAVWEPSFTHLIDEVRRAGTAMEGREQVLGDAIDAALARGMKVAGCQIRDGFYADIGTYDEIVDTQMRIAAIQR